MRLRGFCKIKFFDLCSLSANSSRIVSVTVVESVEMDEMVSVWFEAVEDSDTEYISIWRFSLLVTKFAIFVDYTFTDCVTHISTIKIEQLYLFLYLFVENFV